MVVRQLPWKILMSILRGVRNTFYKKKKPDRKQLLVIGSTVEELDHLLREEAFFEEMQEYTYLYEGEILNLRRPDGIEDGYQMAIHLRAFEHERKHGLEILVHREVSRFDDPRAHLNGTNHSWEEGQRRLESVFDELGIQYETDYDS